jgi:hypothetical protein
MEESPEVKSPRKRLGCSTLAGWAILGFILVIFALFGIIPNFVIETPFRLVIGWLAFLGRNVNDITFDISRIMAGALGLGLATGGLHFLARGWQRTYRPENPWKWKWSIAITLAMITMGVAALSVAGVAHQVAWLKGETMVELRFMKSKPQQDVRNITFYLSEYAERHNGGLPLNLSDLAKSALGQDADENSLSDILFFTPDRNSTPEPWLYFGGGMNNDVPNDFILVASPRSSDGLRFAATAEGEVLYLSEEEFKDALSKQAQTPSP